MEARFFFQGEKTMERGSVWMFRGVRQPFAAVSTEIASAAPPAVLSEEEEDRQTADIFRAVLRRLCAPQRPQTGKFIKPVMFILYSEAGPSEVGGARHETHSAISETVRRGIGRRSCNLPLRIVWVEDTYGVGGDPQGEYVPSDGAVVRFRSVRRENAGLALVDGSIHHQGMPPLQFEYTVEKKSGFWMVRSSYHRWVR
jgi:hypothetical protein